MSETDTLDRMERSATEQEVAPWWMRSIRAVERALRPALGWLVLFCCVLLAWLPGEAAFRNEWLTVREMGPSVEPLGPLAVLLVWLLWGWRREQIPRRPGWKRNLWHFVLLTLCGFVAITQALVGWIPGPGTLRRTIGSGAWAEMLLEMGNELARLALRLVRWTQGVIAGGATQDDVVVAAVAGVLLWIAGCWTARLARRQRSGLLVALPSLWLLGFALMYGFAGRSLLVMGLLVAILLHLALDQRRLIQRWESNNMDYHPSIFTERILFAAGVTVAVLTLAALFPSVRINAISSRYYQFYMPVNQQVEGLGERMFPELRATSRFRGNTVASGLPNDFLLGSGPELSRVEVMRVRTDELVSFDPILLEEAPPIGHYVRGGTLSTYTGLGWQNPPGLDREPASGASVLADVDEPISVRANAQDWDLPPGRRALTQDIFLSFNSFALYAAPEPLVPSIDYRVEQRSTGDVAALWTSEPSRRVRNYTVVSAIPAVSDAQLTAEPAWDENNPLPPGYEMHLQLPDTITDRTRDLAAELTEGLESPYAKAQAIEAYLRGFEYDLSVQDPPNGVIDVADYFLFELQRGYCDYYATAFIALARLNGLPTRFATGFAAGYWNPADGMFVITEAEAHSWPEVYFPTYGWIPFEPTAGRSMLPRIGLAEPITFTGTVTSTQSNVVETETETPTQWNWQMLVWVIPLALLAWGGVVLFQSWRERREDPWQGVLRWGRRVGRPLQEGETVLEYGAQLADYTLTHEARPADMRRIVAREVQALSQDVSLSQYGAQAQRSHALERATERWKTLRGYLRRLRLRTS